MNEAIELVKKPKPVRAIQWTGENIEALGAFAPGICAVESEIGLRIQAGQNGAQGWVPVPVGHWIFGGPGDYWPVSDEFVRENYDRV